MRLGYCWNYTLTHINARHININHSIHFISIILLFTHQVCTCVIHDVHKWTMMPCLKLSNSVSFHRWNRLSTALNYVLEDSLGNNLSVSFSSYLSQCTVQNIVKLSKVSSFIRPVPSKSADWVGVWSTRPKTKSAQYIVVRSVGSFDEMRHAFSCHIEVFFFFFFFFFFCVSTIASSGDT